MRIFLIHIRDPQFYALPATTRAANGNIRVMGFPPIGIMSLSAVLKRAGHECVMFDQANPETPNSVIIEEIRRQQPVQEHRRHGSAARVALTFDGVPTRRRVRVGLEVLELGDDELRASVEPAVPGRWFRSNPEGDPPSWLTRCARQDGWTEPGWSYVADRGRRICAQYKPGLVARPDGGIRASAYHAVLDPGVIDDYRLYGYCLVMTVNTVRDRALETGDPDARAYYERLARESRVIREFSPYDQDADPVPFSFDLSYNYYPPEYHRPGPAIRIHRLKDCRQATGPPIVRIPRAREPAPAF
jgi:hypothetical protein